MAVFEGLGSAGSGSIKASTVREANRATTAFLRGKPIAASCAVGKGPRDCHIQSDGLRLNVRGNTVVRRSAPNVDVVEVCLTRGASAEERAVARSTMRKLHAGTSVKDVRGSLRISGGHGRAGMVYPGGCVSIRVPAKTRVAAAKNLLTTLAPAVAAAVKGRRGKKAGGAFSTELGAKGAPAAAPTVSKKAAKKAARKAAGKGKR